MNNYCIFNVLENEHQNGEVEKRGGGDTGVYQRSGNGLWMVVKNVKQSFTRNKIITFIYSALLHISQYFYSSCPLQRTRRCIC